jgi:hypothetical protein
MPDGARPTRRRRLLSWTLRGLLFALTSWWASELVLPSLEFGHERELRLYWALDCALGRGCPLVGPEAGNVPMGPLYIHLLALLQRFTADPRLEQALAVGGFAASVVLLAVWSRRYLGWLPAFVAVAVALLDQNALALLADNRNPQLAVLPMTVAVILLAGWWRERRAPQLAGSLFALALAAQFHLICGLLLPAVLALGALAGPRPERLRGIAAGLGGWLLGHATWLVWFALLLEDPAVPGAFLAELRRLPSTASDASRVVAQVNGLGPLALMILGVAAAGFVASRHPKARRLGDIAFPVVAVAALPLAFYVVRRAGWQPQYRAALYPFFPLLSAIGIAFLAHGWQRARELIPFAPRWRVPVDVGLAAFVLLGFGVLTPPPRPFDRLGSYLPQLTLLDAARAAEISAHDVTARLHGDAIPVTRLGLRVLSEWRPPPSVSPGSNNHLHFGCRRAPAGFAERSWQLWAPCGALPRKLGWCLPEPVDGDESNELVVQYASRLGPVEAELASGPILWAGPLRTPADFFVEPALQLAHAECSHAGLPSNEELLALSKAWRELDGPYSLVLRSVLRPGPDDRVLAVKHDAVDAVTELVVGGELVAPLDAPPRVTAGSPALFRYRLPAAAVSAHLPLELRIHGPPPNRIVPSIIDLYEEPWPSCR